MSSPSPNSTQQAALASLLSSQQSREAAAAAAQQQRRVSQTLANQQSSLNQQLNASFTNPLSLSSMNSSNANSNMSRSLTPPSQQSPNSSFLAGLSSRLVRGTSGNVGGSLGMNSNLGNIGSMQTPQIMQRGMPMNDIFNSMSDSFGGGVSGQGFGQGFRGNNFGIPTGSGNMPPSTHDFNEFPTLGGQGSHQLSGGSAPGSNRPNYVGQVVKELGQGMGPDPRGHFNMDEMDFPALPGSGPGGNRNHDGMGMSDNNNLVSGPGLGGSFGSLAQPGLGGSPGLGSGDGGTAQLRSGKRGIQTTKEGRVTNIPMGMVTDQFGMIGLLTFIRAAESDQNLVSLALGTDLTTLKLDLNSADSLYANFPGPWSDVPLKPHEIDYPVPSEYLIYNQIRDKLAPIKLARYGDDTLFYLFYMFPSDLIQIAAATELYQRDWRFHKDEKVWITRAPGLPPAEKTGTYERGTYFFFDHHNWRRVAKEFHLDYDRLENRPANTALTSSNNSNSSGGASMAN